MKLGKIIVVIVGFLIEIIGSSSAMDTKDFLVKMESLCQLEQEIQTAKSLSKLIKPTNLNNNDDVFLIQCIRKYDRIINNSYSSDDIENLSLNQLLFSGIVHSDSFELFLSLLNIAQKSTIDIYIENNSELKKSLLPFLPTGILFDNLSLSQKISLLGFVSQISKTQKNLEITNPYLLHWAINRLSEEIREKNSETSKVILTKIADMIPKELLEGFEISDKK